MPHQATEVEVSKTALVSIRITEKNPNIEDIVQEYDAAKFFDSNPAFQILWRKINDHFIPTWIQEVTLDRGSDKIIYRRAKRDLAVE